MWPAPRGILAALWTSSLLFANQSLATAEAWTLVHEEPNISYYLERAVSKRQETHLAYWILINFRYDPRLDGAQPYKSVRLLRYANCATRHQDNKSILQFHDTMGQGEPAWVQEFDSAAIRMEPAEVGSLASKLLEVACSRTR